MLNETAISSSTDTDSPLRSLFLLDPDLAFLNHGSFGACPRPVFENYVEWIRHFESSPVKYHARNFQEIMLGARTALGRFINVVPNDVVYVTNATVAVNIVAKSLQLGPGDELLTTDHEYGACNRTWELLRRKQGFDVSRITIPTPVSTSQDIVERVVAGFTERTKALFISHITSPTALIFPIAEICQRAREHGIITVVDGAHAIGQIPLDLQKIDPDFYTSNLHKWLCAPKGSAFLYARPDVQERLDPLVVSWGWEPAVPVDSTFIAHHEYQGTREVAPFLATESALAFRDEHNWNNVSQRCHRLVRGARTVLSERFGFIPTSPDSDEWYAQMSAFFLPEHVDGPELQRRLFDEHGVEIPVFEWNGQHLIRVSIQAYNQQSDLDRLYSGIEAIIGDY